ncbi:unnamed protein product [Chrysodeixis includens]|uniref:Protein kinase domain-containing protein n=1 Tax=Chrysodeixis includens TaxID=689277 RepID=A0A9N8L2Q4_CHRIL|nr:unnamed protein product [Chrysodeixis includens]
MSRCIGPVFGETRVLVRSRGVRPSRAAGPRALALGASPPPAAPRGRPSAAIGRGRRHNPSQSVAVKVVTKKGIQKASEILVKEIKILRELTALHHTNLVAMHDCMDSPAYVYVVMECVDNHTGFRISIARMWIRSKVTTH